MRDCLSCFTQVFVSSSKLQHYKTREQGKHPNCATVNSRIMRLVRSSHEPSPANAFNETLKPHRRLRVTQA